MTLTSHNSLYKIFCIVGPSGTGKSAVSNLIPLPKVISYRTRDKRSGERDGVDGHFITKQEFLNKESRNEWIAKTYYAENYYGITQGELIELEESPMLYVIDWDGIESLKKEIHKIQGYTPNQIISIFLHTPRSDLEGRMIKQKRSPNEIKIRLDRADIDYAHSSRCDYIVDNLNGEIHNTANEIMNIIFKETFPNQVITNDQIY